MNSNIPISTLTGIGRNSKSVQVTPTFNDDINAEPQKLIAAKTLTDSQQVQNSEEQTSIQHALPCEEMSVSNKAVYPYSLVADYEDCSESGGLQNKLDAIISAQSVTDTEMERDDLLMTNTISTDPDILVVKDIMVINKNLGELTPTTIAEKHSQATVVPEILKLNSACSNENMLINVDHCELSSTKIERDDCIATNSDVNSNLDILVVEDTESVTMNKTQIAVAPVIVSEECSQAMLEPEVLKSGSACTNVQTTVDLSAFRYAMVGDSDSIDTDSSSSESAVTTAEHAEAGNESDDCPEVCVDGPTVKGELSLNDLPPIEELHISVPENLELVQLGNIHNVVGRLVVVKALKDSQPLDADSILFRKERKPFGKVFETFGLVAAPFYSVRFNSTEDVINLELEPFEAIYFAPAETVNFTQYVFLKHIKQQKGSDASWWNHSEPPEKHLDYSDDEEERLVNAQRKAKKREMNAKNGDRTPNNTKNCRRDRNGRASHQQGHHNRLQHFGSSVRMPGPRPPFLQVGPSAEMWGVSHNFHSGYPSYSSQPRIPHPVEHGVHGLHPHYYNGYGLPPAMPVMSSTDSMYYTQSNQASGALGDFIDMRFVQNNNPSN